MNPLTVTIPFIELNSARYGLSRINPAANGVGGKNWHVRTWDQSITGRQLSVYERPITVIRIGRIVGVVAGVEVHKTDLKDRTIKEGSYFFAQGSICLTVQTLGALEMLLDEYFDRGSVAVSAVESVTKPTEIFSSVKKIRQDRLNRLAQAPSKPAKEAVTVTVYLRNADVIAEVLYRANGKCEICESLAPFLRRSDSEPFLEVHHKIRLADEGDDTVANAIALCPNCHRQQHFG